MSFDRLARFYPKMESLLVGETLQQCRLAFLKEVNSAKKILLVGEGHGRFLQEVLRVNREAQVVCVEQSTEMVKVARRGLKNISGWEDRTEFIPKPIEEFHQTEQFDFVATQFFLDCFEREKLETTISHLTRLICPGGRWVVCDFQVPEQTWKAIRARTALFLAYRFFRVVTRLPAGRLVPPQEFLQRSGMRRVRKVEFNYELLYAELWEKSVANEFLKRNRTAAIS